MKKILFATTALVATAGAASADIALSGWAEMGIVGGDRYGDNAQFHTDIDVSFTMTGEADNGLTFGAVVDLDENGAFGNGTQGGETIHVAYGAAKLTMGDVDGAFDAAMQEVNIGGSIDDSETWHAGFNANSGMDGTYDGQIAQFAYSFNSFTGYLSVELDDAGVFDPVWGIGARYSAELAGLTLGVGIGYQSGDENNATVAAIGGLAAAAAADAALLLLDPGATADERFEVQAKAFGAVAERSDVWGISLDTTFSNGLQARLNYSEANYSDVAFLNDETESFWGLGLGYSMNALTIGANFGKYDDRYGIDGLEAKGFGLAVNYDLGGGLEAQMGYGKEEVSAPGVSYENDSFSLGLSMSF
ncbi:porin [Tropicibacter oceani]|uniref:Porin n=1 Tax=Tropicibacter oceani TaxID=3058420 RepID=A0ABY8QM32_9RHOB|nr:porin [Tropicibacter oceani]WGW04998.1 porin [Tropicibacter oceani]